MAQLFCEVNNGLRAADASITVHDYSGKPEFFPLDRGMITEEAGRSSISVFVIHHDQERDLAFVALPVETDSGSQRIWVKGEQLQQLEAVH